MAKMVLTFRDAVVASIIVLHYRKFRDVIPKTIPKVKNSIVGSIAECPDPLKPRHSVLSTVVTND
jgi:hypothetical protein